MKQSQSVYDGPNSSHAKHFLEKPEPTHGEPYFLSCPLPKWVLIKDYPVTTRNFGQKLRKSRIDGGLMIKDLAKMLGVTQDTVINWELRGISPSSQNLKSVENVLAGLGSSKIENHASFRIQ